MRRMRNHTNYCKQAKVQKKRPTRNQTIASKQECRKITKKYHSNYCKQAKVRVRGWDFAKRAHDGSVRLYSTEWPGAARSQDLPQYRASKSACQRLGFCKAGTRWECTTVLDRVARCGKVPRSAAISCKQAKVRVRGWDFAKREHDGSVRLYSTEWSAAARSQDLPQFCLRPHKLRSPRIARRASRLSWRLRKVSRLSS